MENQIDSENRFENRSPSRDHDARRSPSRENNGRSSDSPVQEHRPRENSRERRPFGGDRRGSSRDRRPPSRDRRRNEAPRTEGNSSSLLIRNISENTTNEDLKAAFERFGSISDIYIPRVRFYYFCQYFYYFYYTFLF